MLVLAAEVGNCRNSFGLPHNCSQADSPPVDARPCKTGGLRRMDGIHPLPCCRTVGMNWSPRNVADWFGNGHWSQPRNDQNRDHDKT